MVDIRAHLDPAHAPVVRRSDASGDIAEAVILLDKPAGITSHDVVQKLRRLAGIRRVGHAGTLDPMATGLLICLTGRCTKLSRFYLELKKEYEGTLRLGQTTASYDADTPVEQERKADHISAEALKVAVGNLSGNLVQQTPAFSAVRVQGERLYQRARRGDVRSGPPRIVTVYAFEILQKRGADVDFRVVCSKGTYIRSLAHDLGQNLGVGAHLIRLRRTRVGEIRVDEALSLEEVAKLAGSRRGES